MAFSDFDLKTTRTQFGLTIDEQRDLFVNVQQVTVPERLREILAEWAPVALATNTEKARSEMIITPILMTAIRLSNVPVSLFSGVSFDVDIERGLNGACDFLLTRSPEQFYIQHPVLAIVEAKKENITGGLGQCVAAMVAAQLFNERDGSVDMVIYGAVTTGSNWRFLKLEGSTVLIDRPEYYLDRVDKILGILLSIIQ